MQNPFENINPQDLTFEKVWLMFKETDKKFQETDKKLEQLARTVEQTSAKIDRLAESMAMSKDRIESLAKSMAMSKEKVDRLAEIYGGFMNNVARTAESFYFESLNNILEQKEVLVINGFEFYHIFKNITLGKKKKRREFDIALVNPQQKVLALFEIKMNMRLADVEKFVQTAESYVRADKVFYDYNLILGLGAYTYEEGVIEEARRQGLVILKPNLNENTVIFENIEPENIKVFRP